MPSSSDNLAENDRRQFMSTRWSLVAACRTEETTETRRALEELCQTYWYPLYAYVRRRGYDEHSAQDVTQSFFAVFIEKGRFGEADPARGRFRSFLLASLNHFLANHRRDQNTERRGGNQSIVSLDFDHGESRYRLEPADEVTPENVFERRWALMMIEQALRRLRLEFEAKSQTELFESLKAYLHGVDSTDGYRAIAEKLKMTEGAVKVAAHRMRRRCAELLRDEVAQTVMNPEEVDDEIRLLFTSLGAANKS